MELHCEQWYSAISERGIYDLEASMLEEYFDLLTLIFVQERQMDSPHRCHC